MSATQMEEETCRNQVDSPQAQWRALWVERLRALPPSIQEEKGQAYGFPPRPFSCVMTPDCLQ